MLNIQRTISEMAGQNDRRRTIYYRKILAKLLGVLHKEEFRVYVKISQISIIDSNQQDFTVDGETKLGFDEVLRRRVWFFTILRISPRDPLKFNFSSCRFFVIRRRRKDKTHELRLSPC